MENQNIITISDIIKNLLWIEKIVRADKYNNINKSIGLDKDDLLERLRFAILRLYRYKGDKIVQIDRDINVIKLFSEWKKFDAKFIGEISIVYKTAYNFLIDRTLRLLSILKTTSIKVSEEQLSLEKQRPESVKKNVDDIYGKRQKIKESLEREREREPANNNKIAELQEQLDKANIEFVKMRAQLEKAKRDSIDKDALRSDIDEAFKNLGNYTQKIDDEVKRQRLEYTVSLIALVIISVLLITGYMFFISAIIYKKIIIGSPIEFLPYSLGVGIFASLIAICLYMKGRSNKISIELSTRLFNIHYLEGLMKMTNKLSVDYTDAAQRINVMIESLEQSYIQHIDDNIIPEKLISKWENKELKSSPYIKLLEEIKDILTKLVKK